MQSKNKSTKNTATAAPNLMTEVVLEAIKRDDVDCFIRAKSDISDFRKIYKSPEPWCILTRAADWGSIKVMKLAVKLGIDINAPCPIGDTPLHHAAIWDQREAVRWLIENGANTNLQNQSGLYALDDVVNYDFDATLGIFLELQPDIVRTIGCDGRGNNLLMIAIIQHSVKCALRLVDLVNLDDENEQGMKAFDLSIVHGHAEVTLAILRSPGFNIHSTYQMRLVDDTYVNVPIVSSLVNSETYIPPVVIRTILSLPQVELDSAMQGQDTALFQEVRYGEVTDLLKLLLFYGANADKEGSDKSTPYKNAEADSNLRSIFKFYKKHRAELTFIRDLDKYMTEKDRFEAYQTTAPVDEYEDTFLVENLAKFLKHGWITVQDVLLLGIVQDDPDIVLYALEHHADLLGKTSRGVSFLDIMIAHNKVRVWKDLLDNKRVPFPIVVQMVTRLEKHSYTTLLSCDPALAEEVREDSKKLQPEVYLKVKPPLIRTLLLREPLLALIQQVKSKEGAAKLTVEKKIMRAQHDLSYLEGGEIYDLGEKVDKSTRFVWNCVITITEEMRYLARDSQADLGCERLPKFMRALANEEYYGNPDTIFYVINALRACMYRSLKKGSIARHDPYYKMVDFILSQPKLFHCIELFSVNVIMDPLEKSILTNALRDVAVVTIQLVATNDVFKSERDRLLDFIKVVGSGVLASYPILRAQMSAIDPVMALSFERNDQTIALMLGLFSVLFDAVNEKIAKIQPMIAKGDIPNSQSLQKELYVDMLILNAVVTLIRTLPEQSNFKQKEMNELLSTHAEINISIQDTILAQEKRAITSQEKLIHEEDLKAQAKAEKEARRRARIQAREAQIARVQKATPIETLPTKQGTPAVLSENERIAQKVYKLFVDAEQNKAESMNALWRMLERGKASDYQTISVISALLDIQVAEIDGLSSGIGKLLVDLNDLEFTDKAARDKKVLNRLQQIKADPQRAFLFADTFDSEWQMYMVELQKIKDQLEKITTHDGSLLSVLSSMKVTLLQQVDSLNKCVSLSQQSQVWLEARKQYFKQRRELQAAEETSTRAQHKKERKAHIKQSKARFYSSVQVDYSLSTRRITNLLQMLNEFASEIDHLIAREEERPSPAMACG